MRSANIAMKACISSGGNAFNQKPLEGPILRAAEVEPEHDKARIPAVVRGMSDQRETIPSDREHVEGSRSSG
jgi:hypothetical protein